uniref:Uncharacterized protein n=1 Tax=Leptocylindrus danicus TaxID=163516 RepID=A0A7S2P5V2_9STRA|mmetsp:Transcript_23576/g.35381  ORF Transcript_23576/g.35381 Transcript_23576/m.35381 type:complete len:517 (+) Transcript_23576:546-2096(+)|eukprot:CAMPEP_0116012810 /NCGR_PEP_ID=MMETSP0321-20121206/5346_1 /TAXON_ID=163516 /ORGANISM="Leptocylindrus danicus var. danicus, Strain B650" /LENGTH=516 /DNA_ID=CAMNT_0003482227 /DNA_START=455 /DNA_END=2005 /DNA_ORIENTATION=+
MTVSEPERDYERNSETYSEAENERDDKRRRAQAAQIFDSASNKSDAKYSSKSSASSTVKQVISTRLKDRDDVVDSQGVFDSDSSSASPSHNTSTASFRGRRNRHIDTTSSDSSVDVEGSRPKRQSEKISGGSGERERSRRSVNKKREGRSPTESETRQGSPIEKKRRAETSGTNGDVISEKSIPKKNRAKPPKDGEISLFSRAPPGVENRKVDNTLQRQTPPSRSLSPHVASLPRTKDLHEIVTSDSKRMGRAARISDTSDSKRMDRAARMYDPPRPPKMTEAEIKRTEVRAMRKLDFTVTDILRPLKPNGPPTASILSITEEATKSKGIIDWDTSFADPIEFLDTEDAQSMTQKKQIPLFPEDFPDGKSTYDLHWWGVMGPPQHLLTPGRKTEAEDKKSSIKARSSPQRRSDDTRSDERRNKLRVEDKNGWPHRNHSVQPPPHGLPRGFDRRRDEDWHRSGPGPQPSYPPFPPGFDRFDNGPPPEFNERNGPPRYGGYPDERVRALPPSDRGRRR